MAIYNGILLSITRNEFLPVAIMYRNLEGITLSEAKSNREKSFRRKPVIKSQYSRFSEPQTHLTTKSY